MPYPKSPFGDDFNNRLLLEIGDDDDTTVNEIQIERLEETLEWLCKAPEITSFRVNTLKANVGDVQKYIQTHIAPIAVERHPLCDDVLFVRHPSNLDTSIQIHSKEVVVDPICAAAVLRGAHIYAPGVMGMMKGTQIGDTVSVFVDVAKKCKKGFQKCYDTDKKIFIGNGIAKMRRSQLFNNAEAPMGIAIQIIATISNCPPSLGDNFLPPGTGFLQNFPSIICVHVLAPHPYETILDMCASPGNKTTHIAALLQNKGKLVAIDKTPNKVTRLKSRCEEFGAVVEILQDDSTKLVQNKKFEKESFDRILLDAPCSAIGQRPQITNAITAKVLRSYVPLQRKLFENAFHLLKKNGVLVYSTCTISLAENEGIVAWALRNFDLYLIEAAPLAAGPGLPGAKLSTEQL